MLIFDYLNLFLENIIFNFFDLLTYIVYVLDVIIVFILILLSYTNLIIDMSELFSILLLLSILVNSIFNLLIQIQQLVVVPHKSNSSINFKESTNRNTDMYTNYMNYFKFFNFKTRFSIL